VSGPRSWSYQGRQDVSLRLCRAVLRVDVVLAQKITEPLDLIAQGWEGGPLPLASGLVVQQPFSLSRSAAEFSKSWASMAASLSRRTCAISRSSSRKSGLVPTRCSRIDRRRSIALMRLRSLGCGASLRELMDRMGHSSTRAALIYQHLSDERQRKLADAVGEAARAALLRTATPSGTEVARRPGQMP
jgi:hypothetical protein